MHRINKQLHIACGCLALGCATAAFAASGIPTLSELPRSATADRHDDLMRHIAHGLVREVGDEHRFRNFADLFLVAEEHQPPGGLGASVTAAIFGQGETNAGGPVFGGGSSTLGPMSGNGNTLESGSSVANNGPVNASLPGGSGGASGGGGGMGGGGFAEGELDAEFDAAFAGTGDAADEGDSGNGSGNENIVSFSDNAPNGHNHEGGCCCCCCCPGPGFKTGLPVNGETQGEPLAGGNSADAGMTAAIPLPAPLWIGLVGLGAVGWMRRRRLVT